MLTGSNKERLQQEIGNLIKLISDGRTFFFRKTRFTVNSSDNFLNHFTCIELFNSHQELTQLELNIQLLYIKLSSYYQLVSDKKMETLKKPRNAFAHDFTDLIFNKRVRYNFFLYKVSENFKRVEFLFYTENPIGGDPEVKTLDLDLDNDIKDFIAIWSQWSKAKSN
jgi:hypothetical protein